MLTGPMTVDRDPARALAAAVRAYQRRHGGEPPARLVVRAGTGAPESFEGVPVVGNRHVPLCAVVAEGPET